MVKIQIEINTLTVLRNWTC